MLNRSLNELIQVGKEFEDVGRLWSHFYDGADQVKQREAEVLDNADSNENKAVNISSDDE